MGNILSILIFSPLIAAIILMASPGRRKYEQDENAKWFALFTTGVALLISLFLFFAFDRSVAGYQFKEDAAWIFGFHYRLGLDGISVALVCLTAGVMPLAVLSAWNVRNRVRELMVSLLLSESLIFGTFAARDLFLFYLFFEASLIPMFLIIGIWGGKERIYAAFKFFLYTFFGSVLMLVAMIVIYFETGTSDLEILSSYHFGFHAISLLGINIAGGLQALLWLAFFVAFAVKLPMWPVHTWLPDAHVQAPTAGSVILAALLLKMGGYGFLRFNLPMFPVASEMFAPLVLWLSVIAIVYASLVALVQEDFKKLVAYSSVAHMGFVTVGIFSFSQQGIDGAIFQMISHGIISAALFLGVGVIYDRIHTREIGSLGGIINRAPIFVAVFMVFILANIGLPGTSGFIGEFLPFLAVFQINTWVAVLAASGVILSAAYGLWVYRKVFLGVVNNPKVLAIVDLDQREKAMFFPLVALVIFLGVYPSPILKVGARSVEQLVERFDARPINSVEADDVGRERTRALQTAAD